SERSLDVRHAIVQPELDLVIGPWTVALLVDAIAIGHCRRTLRRTHDAMSPQIGKAFGELCVVGERHAAFAGRDDLDRVKAENGDVTMVAGADLAAAIFTADGVRGVLDDTKAVAVRERADFDHLTGLAGKMHGHDHLR